MDRKKIINDALSVSYTIVYPIEKFTIDDLVKLSSEAKKFGVELRIREETSNFYQGTLLEVQRFNKRGSFSMEKISYVD
jgi:hypothetical protein